VIIIGLLSYKTAELCMMHIKRGEDDLTKVVLRLLGPTWHKVYCFSGGMYLGLCSGVFYLFILNTLYSTLNFITLKATGHSLLSKNVSSFS